MAPIQAKRLLLDSIRRSLMIGPAERRLARLAAGRDPQSLVGRALPRHYQYRRSSLRTIQRGGIKWADVDISDLPQWYLYFGLRDPGHERLLELVKPGDVIVDIGANVGLTALPMGERAGSSGVVYAFEPDRENHASLIRHCRANPRINVRARRLALGSAPGIVGLRAKDEHNRGMVRVDLNGVPEVEVVPLDAVAQEQQWSRLDLVKIDVEGFESQVISGARRTLQEFRPVLFIELNNALLREHGSSSASLIGAIESLGYACRDCLGIATVEELRSEGRHCDIICEPR